jgi:hypothetical protein
MAIYKIFPSKDATLYSEYPYMNTGLDEMTEIRNIKSSLSSNNAVSRYVSYYDQSTINYVFDNLIKENNYQINLRNFVATAEGINQSSIIEIFPLASSWTNGTGYYLDSPQTQDGVSWLYNTNNTQWSTSSFGEYTTASFIDSNRGGGVWYTGSSNPNLILPVTQSFNVRVEKDLNADVTNIVNQWYITNKKLDGYILDTYISASYFEDFDLNNNGFIVKWEDSIEFNNSPTYTPDMKFYSIDTYTIYPPQLEFKWDDTIYSSSLNEIKTEDIFISLDENPGVFYEDSINRFRLNLRPKYPERTYQTGSLYTQNFILPTASYYAVKDLDTNEYVIDFDENYTKISADDISNYFTIYMNGLEPERNYQVLIKTEINNSVLVYKDELYFKIVNG